jgi:hypothetical protein
VQPFRREEQILGLNNKMREVFFGPIPVMNRFVWERYAGCARLRLELLFHGIEDLFDSIRRLHPSLKIPFDDVVLSGDQSIDRLLPKLIPPWIVGNAFHLEFSTN